MKKLVLFDIDGTLLVGENHIHLEAFDYAFKHLWNVNASINEIDHAGKTDRQCVFEVLQKHNIERSVIEKNLPETFQVMMSYFKKNLISRGKYVLNPGVKELLLQLIRDKCVLGVVSGNFTGIGKLKLKALDILDFFNVFGFGEISERRSDLVKEAIKQAEKKYNQKFLRNDIFVVGDTPFDIMSGKDNKTKTIAVVAYRYTADELKKYKPDYLFQDFKNYKKVVEMIEA